MALHNRKLSFTTPIVVGFAGILLSFMLIAIFVTLAQQKDFLEDYHDINRNFTHNLAINYTETLLRENDFILGRAAAFFARNDELNRAVNVEPEKGLTTLMQLQNMMPSVSSISLADTKGHYLRAPEVLENEDSRAFDPKTRPWFIKQAEASTFSHYTSPYMDYSPTIRRLPFSNPSLPPKGNSRAAWPFISISPPWGSRCARWWRPYRGNFCGATGWQSGPALRPGRAV
ncbi:diguanylate cyclase/phosphodiesterase [Klebsiella pneumoniae]|uniref:Diguanylate cyclase/phosphodiesterase n=1 Tax=Klebsiella pneumoniae TaxID=573 RepID=A0A4P0XIF0_KLEPN|nr:diguanylate cyclase/phosphodiesterase [Klebsiella pneumoniae]